MALRRIIVAQSPIAAAAAAGQGLVVFDARRCPALLGINTVAVDCGARARGVVQPERAVRSFLTGLDLAGVGLVQADAECAAAAAAVLGRQPDPMAPADLAHAAPMPGSVLLTSAAPPAGWAVITVAADQARAQPDTVIAQLRASQDDALCLQVVPNAGADAFRSAERAARIAVRCVLQGLGLQRAMMVREDAMLRAVAAAWREPAMVVSADQAGLVLSAGKRSVLVRLAAGGKGPPSVP
ncbi:MAG: hypothetical protein PF961_09875 [Planctomycetota bacterium]|jgi:hypothetical protein|nr:hypothetical protein [Planctomycetota bacterium]